MSSDIGFRLGCDASGFKGALTDAQNSVDKFGGEIASRVAGKLTGMRDISNAVATALGINLTSIAENIARVFTGMSKEEEAAFKTLEKLSGEVADAAIKNMRAVLTEEQRYQLNLRDREKLQRQIGDTDAKNAVQMVAAKIAELKLAEKTSEILTYEKKQREELAKAALDAAKTQFDAAEKSVQAGLNILDTEKKIAALKFNIAATEATIASGALTAENSARFAVTLAERRNQLVTEEAKLKDAVAKQAEQHAKRMEDLTAKEIEDKRESLTASQQMVALKADEAGWKAVLADKDIEASVRQNAEFELAKVRAKMRETEKSVTSEQTEIAKLVLKGAENLTAEEKLRLDILTGQVKQKAIDKEISELNAKALAGMLTPAERERLAVLTGQSEELKKQLKDMKGLADQAALFVQSLKSTGPGYDQQSEDALGGTAARLRSQLDAQKRQNAMLPPSQRVGFDSAINQELSAVEAELAIRGNVQNFASRFGEADTRAKFGDQLTDRALRNLTDRNEKTGIAIDDIQNRLALLFPKKG